MVEKVAPLRVIFCGTPAFGLPTLRLLLNDRDSSVEAVFTQPDRPRGRGHESSQSPIKEAALKTGVRVHQPQSMRASEVADLITQIKPDAAVVIAYGQIIPKGLLDIPRLGWINLHASMLPKYRGAAPVQRAILAGERQTGLTIMQIDAGLDTGPILEQIEVNIGADETSPELLERMSRLGAPMILDSLRKLERGMLAARPQDNALATLAPPIKKEEGRIDWAQSAAAIYNRIRAFDPWPGTYSSFRGRLCHIWGTPAVGYGPEKSAECGTIVHKAHNVLVACGLGTWLRLASVHLEGRKRVTAAEFANGARLTTNDRLGS
ncbi:MAG TPA: methionyl-tRNA formyltransferase [Candidatus Acidoferrales bacterium]|nr:methionyl-tRNA formyltransferase [Candidatus Acidoferrales bacterium]